MRKYFGIIVTIAAILVGMFGGAFGTQTVQADSIGQEGIFVLNLYRKVLEREPDEDGFKFWVTALQEKRMSATEVAGSFYFSDEYRELGKTREQYVRDLYQGLLGREPSMFEKLTWLDAYKDYFICIYSIDCGIFNGFTGSQEFANLCSENGLTVGEMYITNLKAVPYDSGLFPEPIYGICQG